VARPDASWGRAPRGGRSPRARGLVARAIAALGLVPLALALAACETESGGGPPQILLDPLVVASAGPAELLLGTHFLVHGAGFVADDLGSQEVVFRGAGGSPVGAPAEYLDDRTIAVTVDAALRDHFGVDGPFAPVTVEVVRRPRYADDEARASIVLPLRAVSRLTPTATGVSPTDVYPGAPVQVAGAGFLQLSEGTSLVVFDGEFTTTDPPLQRPIVGLAVPGRHRSREALEVSLTPDLFGIRPGRFVGRIVVVNQVPGQEDVPSNQVSGLTLAYGPAVIESVSPTSVRRGQRVVVTGRGLVPTDSALEATTLILLDGTFAPRTGPPLNLTGSAAMALFPDGFRGGTTMEYVLRVTLDPDGQPQGLGLVPGVFQGSVVPLLLYGQDRVRGTGMSLTLTVEPQLQVIHVKFLPSFDDALDKFGLRAVADRVRARIMAVCARDYEGVSVRFQEALPTDFAEYGVVEILGDDPNRAGLFGLDNTAGKDVGNLRFNDVVGGVNAETGEAGFYPFGGVFVSSFLQFSPNLGDEVTLADARFDDVFSPFVPALGGTPVAVAERDGGPRSGAIDEAVRVLGNLVGSTVTHEVGHSLGLAAVEGNFHNVGDEPNRIMDAGSARPFRERAELDGQGPAVFAPHNRSYLERILPIF
jgi:hypothetical protein